MARLEKTNGTHFFDTCHISFRHEYPSMHVFTIDPIALLSEKVYIAT